MSKAKQKLFALTLIILFFSSLAAMAVPQIVSVQQNPDVLGGGRLTSIAVDTLDQPHIAADGGSMLYLYDKIGQAWQDNSINVGTRGYTQFYNPEIAIDANNVAWCSGVVFGSNVGMAMVVRENAATAPADGYAGLAHHPVTPGSWGVGEVSLDPKDPGFAYLAGSSGFYGRFQFDVTAAGKARQIGDIMQQYAGSGGEKNGFWVSKNTDGDTIIHTASNGYARQDSRYRNSTMANGVDWAAYSRFPSMGNDGAYLDLKSDSKNPQIGYLASAFYGTGVYMNIWNGAAMLRGDTNLFVIDPNGEQGLRRFSPQMYPANNGGVYVTYTRNENVMLQYVTPTGETPWGNPVEIGPGGRSSICVDSVGNIHLAYTDGGQTKYRLIEMAGDGGLDELFGAVENDDGSYTSEWFGSFEIVDGNWIDHETLGSILISKSSNENIVWFYTESIGWAWTRSSMFPYFYSMNDANFVWYKQGTTDPAWFYRFNWDMWTTDEQGQAVINVDTRGLSPTCFEGEDAEKATFQVSNTGTGLLSYRVSDDAGWVILDPTGGNIAPDGSTEITVTYSTSELTVGEYTATITAWAPGAQGTPITIPVTLTVKKQLPVLAVEGVSTSSPIELTVDQGFDHQPIQFTVKNDGPYTLYYDVAVSEGVNWLSVDLVKSDGNGGTEPATGSVYQETDTRTITFDTNGLAPASYQATVAITGTDGEGTPVNDSPAVITINLTVNAVDPI